MISGRIVIVEDERIVAEDLSDKLNRMGHSVVGAASEGEEAIRMARELKPDLVLMDIRLSGPMDGTEAARRIHEDTGASIVYLTAYAEVFLRDPSRMQAPGVCVSKPFSTAQLQAAIDAALSGGGPAQVQ